MKKEFIPYELALALKELGFDEETFGFYWNDTTNLVCDNAIGRHHGSHIQAPLYQQAFRWFREKYKLLHSIHGIHSIEPFELDCQILNISNGSSYHLKYSGDDYEQAELECLKKLIQIVKAK